MEYAAGEYVEHEMNVKFPRHGNASMRSLTISRDFSRLVLSFRRV
jgi:hypothetical protein